MLRLGLAATAVLSFGVTLGVLVVPLYDMHLFDGVLTSRSLDTLVLLSVLCLIGLALHGVLIIIRGLILAAIGARVVAALSAPALAAAIRQAVGGDVRPAARALADLQEMRLFFGSGTAAAPFDLACTPLLLAVLFLLHPSLGWFALGAALVMLALSIATDAAAQPRLARAEAATEAALGEAASLLRDRVLRDGFGMGTAIARCWRTGQAKAAMRVAQASREGEALAAGSRLVRALLQGGMLAFAALLVLRDEATPGVLVGSNLLFALLLAPIEKVIAQWRSVAAARLAWQRLATLLRDAAPAGRGSPAMVEGIVVDSVSFRAGMGQSAILSGVSLRVGRGQMVVLAGPNGAGKSTLARLAAGVLGPSEGSVTVDGVAAAAAAEAGSIGYLPQRAQILEGTIAENIARFREGDAAGVVEAARRAGLHAVIGRLPRGYATLVGPESPVLSGGERQRLALARALFGAPRAFVLDEPDAALDHAGETILVEAIEALRHEGAAILVVSHRRRLIALADAVVRLEAGRIVADGAGGADPTQAQQKEHA